MKELQMCWGCEAEELFVNVFDLTSELCVAGLPLVWCLASFPGKPPLFSEMSLTLAAFSGEAAHPFLLLAVGSPASC